MNKNIVMFLIIGSSMMNVLPGNADPVPTDEYPRSHIIHVSNSNETSLWFNSPNPAGSDQRLHESEAKKAEKVENATNAAIGQGK